MPDDVTPRAIDLHILSIAETASLIERRQLSLVELTRAFLDGGARCRVGRRYFTSSRPQNRA